MTVVLTCSILVVLVTAIKIVANTLLAMTCLTYDGFDAPASANYQHTTHVHVGVCGHIRYLCQIDIR